MLMSECVCAYIRVCVRACMHQCRQACRLKSGQILYMMYRIELATNQSINVSCKHYIAGQWLGWRRRYQLYMQHSSERHKMDFLYPGWSYILYF